MEPTAIDSVEPPANVLLLHDGGGESAGCRGLCDTDGGVASLRVSFASHDRVAPRAENTPAKCGLIAVGDVLRASSVGAGPDFAAPVAVDAVADPTDLSAIGVSVSRFCEEWLDDERLVVCFRSLDALLGHSSPETIFEFVYYLTERLASVGALAHFHLDPSLHDDLTVVTFGEIFDEVVADDDARDAIPEASDEDVARILADLDAPDDAVRFGGRDRRLDEATDEEIQHLLGD